MAEANGSNTLQTILAVIAVHECVHADQGPLWYRVPMTDLSGSELCFRTSKLATDKTPDERSPEAPSVTRATIE